MHIHILGICGTFMGGVAQLAKALGHTVTGCDANVYPPMSTQLTQAGIELTEGFGVAQLAIKPDLWVVGNVVSRGNPLMEAILNQGLPYISGPQWVGEHILRGRKVLAVAGTHGKTSTSSMLAWVLQQAGLNPGFLIGGVPGGFGVSATLGQGECFVIEADEYDTAFFDKRSKFVHYRPVVAILNNLEFDHADIFPDLAAIETQFHHLVRTVPSEGRVVCPANTDSLERVLKRGCWTPVERFSADAVDAPWQAKVLGASKFEVLKHGEVKGLVEWNWSGLHNVNNALAVVAAAHAVGVKVADACKALSEFPGVKRRMELRGEASGVKVYDDFAHHPTAIATTLEGAKARMAEIAAAEGKPAGSLIALFEPRSNTMKMGTLAQALPASFDEAQAVVCYTAGIEWNVRDTLGSVGERLFTSDNLNDVIDHVVAQAKPGDWVVAMSNGSFGGVHQKLMDALANANGAGV
ncbi:MAG: UDP-N-acetylmuramate:L-alanyl-gamma-D-glutamyl-meso-diaminopimelate ligase [Gammaproteobacteria bacterium]|uniref:UDP-N-acetylmuramate:L-alanyl-gamma-D-glutamyl- meso-diaminopimelate ligase n=1 Tax=Limnobacter sp. TaxID=2003368 RepID=UPI001D9CD11D|nr:UDP-N-acetylmuramate:L-alanyl-gamma-D-glutamyl-meso-diaminopimelate ligase [Gammaproteobacteria bacterium]MBU0848711.1 UDP-N-acetylmuramate:L-alanyl-gamma-D-glutamyl-meso-diaminopimelate ligase [Gammaproteobacteria bacterium]MBU1779078.1 UDP-N-acetylmuramate:L-alanyl-gamma-D-glutamyl-meso-diaminopimelate ligase [Gammaproteobacteria bacterium]MBU2087769.1 UDP-N-acetylmuramate:L-alanyl-gamma-D-glutamyl-meso-diaminopimelate ligase [Gammaproteobacteria bacterium]MBU2129541.1 UDP-N-acetylmuramate